MSASLSATKPDLRKAGADLLQKGRLRARLAQSTEDLHAAQMLRGLCFHGSGLDADTFDAQYEHVLIEADGGEVLGCFRFYLLEEVNALSHCYSAQFYDLAPLCNFCAPMIELGRFCIRPGPPEPDVLRLAWATLTRLVDQYGVGLLFGCASFKGADDHRHGTSLARLARDHIGPKHMRPGKKAARTLPLLPDQASSDAPLPPLLKTYLAMGGWVCDHAVVDNVMDTLHVFTAVEIATIPEGRARLLRALAQ